MRALLEVVSRLDGDLLLGRRRPGRRRRALRALARRAEHLPLRRRHLGADLQVALLEKSSK